MAILLSVDLDQPAREELDRSASAKVSVAHTASVDAALDFLWEHGEEVDEIVLPGEQHSIASHELLVILDDDWPWIKIKKHA